MTRTTGGTASAAGTRTGRGLALALALAGALGGACSETAAQCRTGADCDGGICAEGRCLPRPGDAGETDATGEADAPPEVEAAEDFTRPDVPPGDMVCTAREEEAREIRRPLDVIVLPDESSSMGGQRDAVAAAMQTSFLDVMTTAGADFRVVWHGSWPLPALDPYLTYNPVLLGSGDDVMFAPVLDSYSGWSGVLRAEALKVFVHFTDATSGVGGGISGYAGSFDEVLVGLDPTVWGTAGDLRFVYHTFVGLTPNTPPEAPYEPTDGLVAGSCSGAFVNPVPLQELAIRTGGLRFPLCLTDSFSAVFRRIAESAVERTAVPCELELPEPPPGGSLDLATVAIRYTAGTGGETVLRQAASTADCDAASFVIEGERVVLCPEACAVVTADPAAVLVVLSGCDPDLY
jgi:hypothetical protein